MLTFGICSSLFPAYVYCFIVSCRLSVVRTAPSDGHSMALTESGEVFSWGDGDYGKLGHGNSDRNHNRPQQVPALSGIHIQDIAIGAEHTLVLSSTGDVYTWGSNSEGQVTHQHTGLCGLSLKMSLLNIELFLLTELMLSGLGLGHTNHIREPTLATALQGKNIHQISAGRCHSAAWTAPSVPPRAPGQTEKTIQLFVQQAEK
uniref:HECT and RLD domain containing E3 ubiquitin protein ligase family member 1 n=1 Tax=Amphiprion percula TaxID=161767 RepID=A0A3P8RLA2_AMPPE